jgi:hypothetical protein
VGTAAVAIGLATGMMFGLSRLLNAPPTPDPRAAVDAAATTTAPAPSTPAVPKIKATLFFASADGLQLTPVQRDVPLAEGAVPQARAILEAQLAAQAPEPLLSTIPPGVTLRGLFVSQKNEAFVDLDPAIRTAHKGGSMDELLTVYTIVNVLLTNLPALQEVQILIDGHEVDTLAGHVDLRRPLRKNESLIQAADPSVTPAAPSPKPQVSSPKPQASSH